MNEQLYRDSERRLWEELGTTPQEHWIHLVRNDVDVRVLEIGDGPPVVFVHGGPGVAGAVWAGVAARLPEFRCLLVDRPGTGLSAVQPLVDAAAVRRQAQEMLVDVLDALDLESAHVVGSSHGSYIALLSAAAHPDRIDRTVHFGCPGFVEGMRFTGGDRFALLPGVGRIVGAFPVTDKSLRQTLRRLGHSAILENGGLSDGTVDWMLGLQRHTDTMRNELTVMTSMGTFWKGFDSLLEVSRATLEGVRSPSLFVWGENDVYGDESVARGVVDAMPEAELVMAPGAGHLSWIDDLEGSTALTRRHLLT
jgi:2-hydroxy-6-oxonona-2,4-dienedioate hydrolase